MFFTRGEWDTQVLRFIHHISYNVRMINAPVLIPQGHRWKGCKKLCTMQMGTLDVSLFDHTGRGYFMDIDIDTKYISESCVILKEDEVFFICFFKKDRVGSSDFITIDNE